MEPASATEPPSGAAPGLAPGTVVAGRYRVLGLLGVGGMGAVYRAEHVHMRKTVALKVLHPELLGVAEVVARFEREAVAAARIEHPNVVAASDFGKLDDGSFYLVLEFIDGQSLRDLVGKGPVPLARALEIARQTTLALSAAHAADIVHRDLKPDNVMLLSEPDGSERVKVLDFGIARISVPDERRDATHLTRAGVVMGTIAYMSPEQATGQPVDGRTDLYALGVMLYEMIAGHQPFEAELPAQVLARQLVEPPPPLPAGTPAPLVRLVLDLMAKTPADRPASAREVLDRLATLSTPSGRALAPPPAPRRLLIVVGAVLSLLVVALVLLLAGGGGKAAETATREPRASAASPSASGAPTPAATEPISSAARTAPTPTAAAPGASADPAPPNLRPTEKSSGKRRAGEDKSTGKKKTGPGGIYIPPPSQWFKGLE